MSFLQELSTARVAVVGGGVTGSAVMEFLAKRGVSADLFDEKQSGALREVTRDYDLAIISPGWRRDHVIVTSLEERGTRLLSEIDFSWLVKEEVAPSQKWIALTGTNGKTTTIQMVQSIFDSSSKTGIACGNVGEPVISVLGSGDDFEYLALELSSFQLDWSQHARFEAAALLNIAPDHIDWHGNFDDYANAKIKILKYSKLGIINGEDSEAVLRSTQWNGPKIFYSLDTPQAGEIGLVENLLLDRAFTHSPSEAVDFAELSDIRPTVPHNVSNAMAAAGLALAIGITHEEIRQGLKNFVLDHHRLELVLTHNEIAWVNDSKATNPHAATAALLSHFSTIWIAGGLAKGAQMDQLIERCAPRIKAAILMGKDAGEIAAALTRHAPNIPYYLMPESNDGPATIKLAVRKAQELAVAGDTVLLAPACASMDQFNDYAHRGTSFADAVSELVAHER